MSKTADFLVEIGTEELPPHDLVKLALALDNGIKACLQENNIEFNTTTQPIFAAPRRIAALISDIATQQPEQQVSKRGPALSAAYNADGTPTKAALGFAESCGVQLADLGKQETDKGAWLYFAQTAPGKKTSELLPEFVAKALQQLPIAKRMRWGNGEYQFVRPVHWIVMLFGKEVVKANIFGVEADRYTYGHRIHHPKALKLADPSEYAEKLFKEGHVIAEFNQRQNMIEQQITECAKRVHGFAVLDANLLALVTGIVEYPQALLASFAEDFLRVPKECLISAMQHHQKCFALQDQQGNLLPQFILISNLQSTDPNTVIHGNELVMGARLADAAFHFDTDQKQTLASRVEKLKTIVYQKQLGSIYDKIMRVEKLVAWLAPSINCASAYAQRAAYLCKADLLTNMVYEFPELQGIMGKYYALHDNEPAPVATAIAEYYQPRTAQDALPESAIGCALAIVDRIDSLVGLFGTGNAPTGEKDPYALRRQSLAIIRILIEKQINLDLRELIQQAVINYENRLQNPAQNLLTFFFDRLKSWYITKGVAANAVTAVAAENFSVTAAEINLLDFDRRMQALIKFLQLPAATNLAAANKRVANILKNEPNLAQNVKLHVEVKSLELAAEHDLYNEIMQQESTTKNLMQQADYVGILQTLATLQQPVDNFFNTVMVMVDDPSLRTNRLHLLQRLRNLFLQVADISQL